MDVPSVDHHAWKAVLTGKLRVNFESFAVQMIVKRLGLKISQDSTSKTLEKSISELRTLFVENVNAPKISRDLHKIFQRGE